MKNSGVNCIVLDRDGVINEDSPDYIRGLDDWRPIPGSIKAIADLSLAGFSIIVATNQSGIARGLFSLADMQAIHSRLHQLVAAKGGAIAGIYYCPHRPEDDCDCRKPGVGLLQVAEQELGISLRDAWFVGDRITDLQTAVAFGCKPVLVKTGRGATTLEALHAEPAYTAPCNGLCIYDDLAAVAHSLLSKEPAPIGDR
ncbi:MAG: D-glycero-beta-D-manno-heptose 1,7-bisphosphate 7-phosphatase [Pseudomonadota bacterium]